MRWICAALALLASALILGCGGDGASRFNVSGSATFAGKPIPVGKIYFTPDAAKGNSGAAGYADIKDGKFSTASAGGMGTIGGAMLVRIEGADGIALDEDRPNGNPLFTFYEVAVEFPKESTTKDFDVPADAAKAQPPDARQLVTP
jgi:hypothetical protein